uniref:Uncharacterized protein n=1 Tax=Avena sativa TaxID=4498 RepID=A0ACD5XJS2_AVESA
MRKLYPVQFVEDLGDEVIHKSIETAGSSWGSQRQAGAMEGWVNLNRMAQLLNLWAIRVAVLTSFGAHLVLILLAGIRRRKASGVRTLVLWLAYQLANWVAAYALGNMSLGSTSREKELVAFWAPFLLQHLGGPDNISAYSLQDNQLSGRQALSVVVQVGGAVYVIYKHIYMGSGGGGGGAMLPASLIILAVGVAKYVERVLALRGGDLENIGRMMSSSKKQQQITSRSMTSDDRSAGFGEPLDDSEQALLIAHNMFPFCRRAMTDSSVDMEAPDVDISRTIISGGWEDMCKVVEMELSLMYDILYTKAAMVHTWGGYFIRLVSPLATATATLLFWLYIKEGQRREDVIITYALLVGTFLLDVRWLLRALGSTWTHAFLQARPRCWLHDAAGLWRWLRRVIESLDLGRRLAMAPRSSSCYRKWSGTVGQHNLLGQCTRDTSTIRSKMAGSKDEGHLVLSHDVKALVFKRVRRILKSTYDEEDDDSCYTMSDITTSWGQAATKRRHRKLRRYSLAFGREFQEDILVWHIATQVFLSCSRDKRPPAASTSTAKNAREDRLAAVRAKAINALSEYLMFLVAVRREMLPGLALRSLYQVTRDALRAIWRDEMAGNGKGSGTTGEDMLASLLLDSKGADSGWGLDHDKTRLVSDGVDLAMELLVSVQRSSDDMPELLELVFNVWVDKLLYAGTRCSRESHAKQLSRGGELTTIVWIMAEHAGPFRIGQLMRVSQGEEENMKEEPRRDNKYGGGSGKPWQGKKDAGEGEKDAGGGKKGGGVGWGGGKKGGGGRGGGRGVGWGGGLGAAPGAAEVGLGAGGWGGEGAGTALGAGAAGGYWGGGGAAGGGLGAAPGAAGVGLGAGGWGGGEGAGTALGAEAGGGWGGGGVFMADPHFGKPQETHKKTRKYATLCPVN